RERGLDRALTAFAQSGRPLLGICLGMQLLATRSLEFGIHEGLGLMAGDVVPIPPTGADGRAHKVPYVGWTELCPRAASSFAGTALDGLDQGQSVYLVHSYHFVPDVTEDV